MASEKGNRKTKVSAQNGPRNEDKRHTARTDCKSLFPHSPAPGKLSPHLLTLSLRVTGPCAYKGAEKSLT